MSNEHAPTGGEGVTTDGGTAVSSERALTGDDLDALFEVLADDQRRRILGFLDERDDDVAAFSDLVDHAVGGSGERERGAKGEREREAKGDEEGEKEGDGKEKADDRERVAVRLHHAHLPKMADAGLVEYDTRSETVRYRGGPAVSKWVALTQSHDPDAS